MGDCVWQKEEHVPRSWGKREGEGVKNREKSRGCAFGAGLPRGVGGGVGEMGLVREAVVRVLVFLLQVE